MPRPPLTPTLSAAEFLAYYWLKEELVAACREWRLPAGGSKQALTQRIAAYLNHDPLPDSRPAQKSAAMPTQFSRETVIGQHWRCSQALRAFFAKEVGPSFHFNAAMREIIQNGAGKTLQEAIEVWYANPEPAAGETEIASQFEYNRHIRAYFQQHPGATLQEAIAAWREIKSRNRQS